MSYIPEPVTRIDKYLAYIAGNMDVILPNHPITRKEHYLAAWAEKSGFEDVDVTGEPPLTLENAIGKPLKGLRIYGKSKQVTTTGAQLLDLSDLIRKTETKNGATYKINEDQSVTVSGTPTEYTSFYLKAISLKAGSYYFLSKSDNRKAFVQLISTSVDMNNGFTLDEDTDSIGVYVVFNVTSNNTESFNSTFTSMLNAGDVALPWEPYTGGIPSPSPEYPQEIESVVNPTVKVTNEDGLKAQSVTLNNIILNAIPVSSGGNVTINGQQYVADYVDVERGKYVQMIQTDKVQSNITWNTQKQPKGYSLGYTGLYKNGIPTDKPGMGKTWKSNVGDSSYTWSNAFSFGRSAVFWIVPYENDGNITSDDINAWLVEHPMDIMYPLAEPIETPLTSDQLTAYKQLHTYKGTTIIDNDAGAYMSVRYEKMK